MLQEAKEATENVDGYELLAWLTALIQLVKPRVMLTLNNKTALRVCPCEEDDKNSQDLIKELSLHSPIPDLNEVALKHTSRSKEPVQTDSLRR